MGPLHEVLTLRKPPPDEPVDPVERAVFRFCRALRDRSLLQQRAEDVEGGRWLLGAAPEDRVRALRLAVEVLVTRAEQIFSDPDSSPREKLLLLTELVGQLLLSDLELSERDLADFVRAFSIDLARYLPLNELFGAVERRVGKAPASGDLAGALRAYRAYLEAGRGDMPDRRLLVARIDGLIRGRGKEYFALEIADAWTAALWACLNDKPETLRAAWLALLGHASTATSAKPTRAFLKEAERLAEALGESEFVSTLTVALAAVGGRSPVPLRVPMSYHPDGWVEVDPTLVAERHADTLRGLVFTASASAPSAVAGLLGDLGERCFKKVAGHGPRAPKIGNAAVWALSQFQSTDAIAQLVRLSLRVKHASTKKQVDKALAACAERAGLSRQDLEEIAVPSCGLTGIGVLERPLSDFVAELKFTSARSVELGFRGPAGKLHKSPPAAIKNRFADELAQLKKIQKELLTLLPSQCDRVERLLRAPRALAFSEWKRRYLEHPLVGYIARRLIWEFGDARTPAVPTDEGLVGLDGPIAGAEASVVTLWHPLNAPRDVVLGFREWLAERELTQPFKQAHREIYVLTDAERQTGTYSNRFASHVLKQHQFAALCQSRGYSYTLQGGWDSHNTPRLALPELDLRVEFWVDLAGDPREAETSPAGIYLYVGTDQVRFYRLAETEPLPLEDVPPLIFSEVMRDIDLFVGVSSVGADPTWVDGGPERYRTYWHAFAFAELGESAKTRRDALERLVPKLKIADRCSFDERSLVVRGDLRTYRIHLGSANVQMAPNDQYLCIVPGRDRSSAKVMLPFEGDSVLSLILSKAILLAEDRKITDPSILSQIHRN